VWSFIICSIIYLSANLKSKSVNCHADKSYFRIDANKSGNDKPSAANLEKIVESFAGWVPYSQQWGRHTFITPVSLALGPLLSLQQKKGYTVLLLNA
jgi:hypothetical protein